MSPGGPESSTTDIPPPPASFVSFTSTRFAKNQRGPRLDRASGRRTSLDLYGNLGGYAMSSGLSPTRGTTADSCQGTLHLALEWLPGRCRLARKQASDLDVARLRSGRPLRHLRLLPAAARSSHEASARRKPLGSRRTQRGGETWRRPETALRCPTAASMR